jgi:hypothetical protein
MTIGGLSYPSTNKPQVSLVEKLVGPMSVFAPLFFNHSLASLKRWAATSLLFSQSKKPKKPSFALLKIFHCDMQEMPVPENVHEMDACLASVNRVEPQIAQEHSSYLL